MKKQQSQLELKRRNLLTTQQPRKETRTETFSGHVAPANYVHEQVTSTKTTDHGTQEPAGHTTGHQ
jgi:hypothetical protein